MVLTFRISCNNLGFRSDAIRISSAEPAAIFMTTDRRNVAQLRKSFCRYEFSPLDEYVDF